MKVKFRTNVGSRDAAKFDLDFRLCQYGAEVELDDEVAEKVVDCGLAVVVSKRSKPGRPKKVTTDPPKVETEPAAVDVKTSDSKSEKDSE